ncbi:serine hydrolase domain-containing protein [Microbulbifer variabilis]|uniref:serine hydrolase domain-containing protein n=1 Tax=Microbulbifer variabilis TaxID=266805 RepID=UPI001CFE37DB|nr:serine hydrolase domain-containing protein [Microbulbifer variabilis]
MMHSRHTKILSKIFLTIALLAVTVAVRADQALQTFLEQTLTTARNKNDLPAVAALIQIDGKTAAIAADGFRAHGHMEPATIDDRWHIGSNTKALTATMIARLVEQGVMRFEDTLADSFPAFAKNMDPAYRNITITQLLSHTAGLPSLTDDKEFPQFEELIESAPSIRAQRIAVARSYLAMPPTSATGSFKYSNLGYVIAGAIAEARTGKTWEDLIKEQIFTPLGIKNAGFAAPGSSGNLDQPRGHKKTWWGKLVPLDPADIQSDNPQALGPAGTVNISLKDWVLFAEDQLNGVHGRGKLLKSETYRKLHSPVDGNYALGWGAVYDPELLLLTHSGSNRYWLTDARIMPKHNIIFLIAMNSADDTAKKTMKDIGKLLMERLKPFE